MHSNHLWAKVIGIILILVGIVGFFMNPVLGVFDVNMAHNLVHLVTGIIFTWAGFTKGMAARKSNQWLGIIYVLVAIMGFLGFLGFLSVGGGNDPDNYLHLAIGVVSVLIGWMSA